MSVEKLIPNQDSKIDNIIAVMSGKGGVGKSFISSLLTVSLNKLGYNTGILDADITGPSIPKIFGTSDNIPVVNENDSFYPVKTEKGIKLISLNVLTEEKDSPVIWRGPIIANAVGQFYTDVVWGELDYLIVDLPPGTGDVPLTVMQSIDLTGILIVSSPQDLVNLIVRKSLKMAEKMNVPVLGIIENMSYLECPDCGKKIELFGKSNLEESIEEAGLDLSIKLPLKPDYSKYCDEGKVEELDDPLSIFTKQLVSKG